MESSQQGVVKKKETRGRKPKPKDDKKDEQHQQQGKMTKEGKKSQQHSSADDKYAQWKSLVPVLYDWLANHNLVWPSLSCRSLLLSPSLLPVSFSRVLLLLCLVLGF